MRPAPRPADAERQKRIALERQERRAQYAAMAMQGLCSNMDRVVATAEHDGRPEDVDEYLAVLSVAFADALLREIEK